jgi:hypothetical protein
MYIFAELGIGIGIPASSISFRYWSTVDCKGEKEENLIELSRLCPETSKELYVHEFCFW